MSFRREFAKDTAVLAVATLLLYAPVLHGRYLLSDDYYILLRKKHALSNAIVGGRPLTVWLWKLTAQTVDSLSSARHLRAAGILGVLAFGLTLCRWSRSRGFTGRDAQLAALLFVALPPCALSAGWLVCWPYGFAAALAGLSAWIALARMKNHFAWAVAVFPLLFLSLCTYQPSAMCYWTVLAGAILFSKTWHQDRSAGRALWVGIATIGVYFAAHKAVVLLTGWPDTERSTITLDVLGKLRWAWAEVLPNVLNLWLIAPQRGVTVAAAALCGVALALAVAGNRGHGLPPILSRLGILLLVAPLSYAPNLVTRDNWSPYRTLLAPMGFVLVSGIAGWWHATERLRGLTRDTVRTAGLGAATLFAFLTTHWTVTRTLVEPAQRELIFVEAALLQANAASQSKITVVRPEWWHCPAPTHRYDEFGVPTTYTDWGATALVETALANIGLDPLRYQIVTTRDVPQPPDPAAHDGVLLDMRMIDRLR